MFNRPDYDSARVFLAPSDPELLEMSLKHIAANGIGSIGGTIFSLPADTKDLHVLLTRYAEMAQAYTEKNSYEQEDVEYEVACLRNAVEA